MRCRPEARQRARAAADAAARRDPVLATDVLEPATDPTALWTVELTLRLDAGGVPPGVAAELVGRGLTVRESRPRGDHWFALATV